MDEGLLENKGVGPPLCNKAMETPFDDRVEAGRDLAARLKLYADRPDVIVLGLPRGGVEVAAEVARELHVPLDVLVVRKLGVPGQAEWTMGAIASGGAGVLNAEVISDLEISNATIGKVARDEHRKLERREKLYRNGRPAPVIRNHIVILVDDGLLTGATMRAAIVALCEQHPARIVMAVPVADAEICAEFQQKLDEVVCILTPDPLLAVGLWYRHFPHITDEQVRDLLKQTNAEVHNVAPHGGE